MLSRARRANNSRLSPRKSRVKDKESLSVRPWARFRANTGQLSRPKKNAQEPRKVRMRVGAGARRRRGMAESGRDWLAFAVIERHELPGDRNELSSFICLSRYVK